MKGRVYIIDDNSIDLKAMSIVLQKMGYECQTFLEHKEALTRALTAPPQLIFLDIIFPDITGYEIIQLIKSKPQLAKIPILMMSGQNQTTDVVKAIGLGATDYIIKPIDPLVVQEKMKKFGQSSEEFVEIKLTQNQIIEAKQSYSIKIISLNEFGGTATSNLPVAANSTIELTDLPEGLFGSQRLLVRCLNCEMLFQGFYTVQFTFIGLTEANRKTIRNSCRKLFIQSKQEAS